MPDPADTERRLAALEARVDDVAAEATATRQDAIAAWHLAASHDGGLGDLGVKVDANRRAINALGVQTAARFDRVDERFDRVDAPVRPAGNRDAHGLRRDAAAARRGGGRVPAHRRAARHPVA